MQRFILAMCFALSAMLPASQAAARTVQARIAKVTTGVATLQQVRVRLDWPADAASSELQVWAGSVEAPDLGYRYRDLHWRCPLRRVANAGWQCEGELRSGRSQPLRLAVKFDDASTRASLSQGKARFGLHRDAATPDLTTLDLAAVPLAWAQALLQQAWSDAHFKAGTLAGRLSVQAPGDRPLRINGPLRVGGLGLETADASIVGERLNGDLRIDYRIAPTLSLLAIDGVLQGGEFLAGNTYLALPATPVGVRIDATKQAGGGWDYDRLNPAYFRRLEDRVRRLGEIGVQADLILFHPYDEKTGWHAMSPARDDRFIRYMVARFASFSNVWWSLANEWDLVKAKSIADFERIGQLIKAEDPYGRLCSIHNWRDLYDNGRPWITHASIQNGAAVLDESAYRVDLPGGRVFFSAPCPGLRAADGVSIVFTAGYGDAGDVPQPIKSAILQTVSWLYEHRGGDAAPLPETALALLAPYRMVRL